MFPTVIKLRGNIITCTLYCWLSFLWWWWWGGLNNKFISHSSGLEI